MAQQQIVREHLNVTQELVDGKFRITFALDDAYPEYTRFKSALFNYDSLEELEAEKEKLYASTVQKVIDLQEEPESDGDVKILTTQKTLFGLLTVFNLEMYEDISDSRSYARIGRFETFTEDNWKTFKFKYDREASKNPLFAVFNAVKRTGKGLVLTSFFKSDK